MWIQELYIKSFGKFRDERITLGPGMNLIYGENESGKSTLHAFIRGCFYGIRKMRGRASKTAVFSRYQPWDDAGYFAGNMRFVCGDKVFRLERNFARTGKEDVLVCESDGETLSISNGDLEMLLGNVGEVTFDNTVSIGQLKNETDDGLVLELKNYMANMEGTGDSSIRIEKALNQLKDRKKQLEKRLLEKKRQEEEQIRQIESRIQFLKEEWEKEQRERTKLQMLLQDIPEKNVRTGFFQRLIFKIVHFLKRLFRIREHGEKDPVSEKTKILGKIEHLDQQIHDKEIQIKNRYRDIEVLKEKAFAQGKSQEQMELEACNLAMNRIQEVVSQMQMDIGQFLKKRTSEIFSDITEGRYSFVEMSEDLKLSVHGIDKKVPLESLSRGTIWQLYFALRMAANEVLCQEESLPVILDDSFAMYDEVRLGETLRWLCRQKKQVIIFTCQKREREWLLKTGTPFQDIQLTR